MLAGRTPTATPSRRSIASTTPVKVQRYTGRRGFRVPSTALSTVWWWIDLKIFTSDLASHEAPISIGSPRPAGLVLGPFFKSLSLRHVRRRRSRQHLHLREQSLDPPGHGRPLAEPDGVHRRPAPLDVRRGYRGPVSA